MSAAPFRTTIVLVALAACVSRRGSMYRPDAARDWPTVLARMESAVNGRRYAEADRLLSDFAQRYRGTDEANEAVYWRGVIRLDPENRETPPPSASGFFDAYLKGEGVLQHRLEAESLRRLTSRIESLAGAIGAAGAAPPSTTPGQAAASDRSAELKAKDAEIQKLKEDLAKANDELERIKRRLAQPAKP